MIDVVDCFAGIGGFSLGLERTGGFRTRAFCEIDPFCRRVLTDHWPEVRAYDDIRTLSDERLREDGIAGVRMLTGGFPCQDVSRAARGKGAAGLDGDRSGLWRELLRLIRELGVDLCVMENSPALLDGGLGTILGQLAESGYDAVWDCFPATAFRAPHDRDRLYVVAHARRLGQQFSAETFCRYLQNAPRDSAAPECQWDHEQLGPNSPIRHFLAGDGSGVGDGLSAELDAEWRPRIHALGNAVVPQIPEFIGRGILEAIRV